MLRELESLMPRLEAMLCRVPCKEGSDSRKAGVSPCGERKPMRMSQPGESRRLSGQKKHLLLCRASTFRLRLRLSRGFRTGSKRWRANKLSQIVRGRSLARNGALCLVFHS
jgi:hypothetical protein